MTDVKTDVKTDYEVSYRYAIRGKEGNGVYRCQSMKDAERYIGVLRGFKGTTISQVKIQTIEYKDNDI